MHTLKVYNKEVLINGTTKKIYYARSDNAVIYIDPALIKKEGYIELPIKGTEIKFIKKEGNIPHYLLTKNDKYTTYYVFTASTTTLPPPIKVLNKNAKAIVDIKKDKTAPFRTVNTRGVIVTLKKDTPLKYQKRDEKYIVTPDGNEAEFMEFNPYDTKRK